MKQRPQESFNYEEWENTPPKEPVFVGIDPRTIAYTQTEITRAKIQTIFDCMTEEEREETKGMNMKEAIDYLLQKHNEQK